MRGLEFIPWVFVIEEGQVPDLKHPDKVYEFTARYREPINLHSLVIFAGEKTGVFGVGKIRDYKTDGRVIEGHYTLEETTIKKNGGEDNINLFFEFLDLKYSTD